MASANNTHPSFDVSSTTEQTLTWGKIRKLQAHSIINFLRFLISLRIKEDYNNEPYVGDKQRIKNTLQKLKEADILLYQVEEWFKQYLQRYQDGITDGYISFLEHNISKCSGFLFDCSRELHFEDRLIAALFPSTFQIIIGKQSVRYRIADGCISSLMDEGQSIAWTSDMIDRRLGEEICDTSVTNSCREVKHRNETLRACDLINKRCPRLLAQIRIDQAYQNLSVHILGEVVQSQVSSVLKLMLEEELEDFRFLEHAPCHCRNCHELTIPSRILFSEIGSGSRAGQNSTNIERALDFRQHETRLQ